MDNIIGIELFGNALGRWLVALSFVVGGFIVGKLVSWISTNILRRISAKTKNRVDDIVLAVAEKPLALIVTVAGLSFGIDSLAIGTETAAFVDKAFMVLVTIVAAWTANKIFDAIMDEYLIPFARKSEGTLDDQLLPIIRKTVSTLIWVFAALLALKNSGYDVGALLAGLGLGGVAVALAAKDTLSNFFGSVAVFIDRPFKINERIKIAGIDGTVVEIGLRTSRLRTLENRIVTIPNATFASSPIENVSSEPNTKVVQILDLARSNGAAKLAEAVMLLKAVGAETEGTDGTPAAGLSSIGDFSYRMTFVFYVKKGADYLNTVNAVNLEVLRLFEAADIALAFPTRMIVNG